MTTLPTTFYQIFLAEFHFAHWTDKMTNVVMKRIGWSLLISGLVGVFITAAGIIAMMSDETIETVKPSTFSESVSGILFPSVVGTFLSLVGVITLLIGYLCGRSNK